MNAWLHGLSFLGVHKTGAGSSITEPLPDGVLSVAHLATRLHTSSRTVQRRLGEEDTSLRKLVDVVRLQLAREYLGAGQSNLEVALMLGFSDVSAFGHAFRRCTGVTPAAFRDGGG